ncbi:DUF1819 family protein [Rhizobium leguminosarum]|uniref:DUF1819 family protein n=1 Tax=Rhizobium leguminosarum TaxID=384 RepID=UPI001030728A|nr:DUF1819 family protein [Rhizobium leguminosarum]TAX55348.1 DUF1819 family protein [Rhizobium leguminosarum]TBG20524.1 DUF1819 family protein [Rhizobium leguminosarum]TBG46440.1 DUF1819 family protein [Rhizobium leguminosarum]TBG79411.1 DUF1819 family protein [Rhizobium leguminosarum]
MLLVDVQESTCALTNTWNTNLGRYKADIAGGALKVYESRMIADLLLQNTTAEGWKNAIEIENILQKTSINTAKRQAALLKSRLQTLNHEAWQLVLDGSKPVATQVTFAAALAHSNLLADFLDIAVRDRFRTSHRSLSRNNWETFVAGCHERDAEMSYWSSSTVSKLGDTVFQILSEVGLLSPGKATMLQPVPYERPVLDMLNRGGYDHVIRCMQVFY